MVMFLAHYDACGSSPVNLIPIKTMNVVLPVTPLKGPTRRVLMANHVQGVVQE